MKFIDVNHPWPYLATAAFVALMGLYVWKQPKRPRTRYFSWMLGLWVVMALAAAFATVVQTTELRYGLWVLQSFLVLLVFPLELMVSLQYTGNEKWLNRRSLAPIFFPALLFVLLAFILPSSDLAVTEMHSGFEVVFGHDLVRWGFFAYIFLILLINLGVLFTCLLRAPAFSAALLLIALGLVVTPIAFAAVDALRSTVAPIQVAVLFSNFTALAYFIALYNFRFLRVIPVARDRVIYHMPYAMLVLDAENFLVDFNPAAQALPGLPGKLALRRAPGRVLGEWWERISPLIGPELVSRDLVVQTSAGQQYFHVASLPLLQASGWRIGQVFVLEDVTQAQQAQRLQAQTLWAQATLQEREQLANELHDGISQSLAFLNLQAQAAQVHLQAGQSQAAQASLARLTDAAGEVQEDTRELIGHLLAVSLPTQNFCATMRQILAGFEQQTGLLARLEMEADSGKDTVECFSPTRLPPPVAVQLVRITQEALANVRKHAFGASQVSVQLKASEEKLFLAITDDGAGFDAAAQQSDGKHFGLHIMRQRAARIGGQVEVCSAPGIGTRIEVRVPLQRKGADYA